MAGVASQQLDCTWLHTDVPLIIMCFIIEIIEYANWLGMDVEGERVSRE
jgi:hypothetical protein